MSEDLVGFQGIDFPSDKFDRIEARIIIKSMIKAIKPEIIKILPKLTHERKKYSQDSHSYTVSPSNVWSFLGADEDFTKDMHLTFDGIIEVDFDTLKGNKSIKPNPLWLSALRELISHKSSYNGQLMLRTRFFYKDHADIRNAIFKDKIIEVARNFKKVYEYFSVQSGTKLK